MISAKAKNTNRLINESSPYLLQHAHNPVDWYPWGDEAFEKARKEGKPVFLSVGYSTCHWCHVMERESFENEGIAAILNEHFVSIKVDREQRPDVDSVYMNVVQVMTGSGGWPMSVFLTPDGDAFFGGTYFPPKDMYSRPGFETILKAVIEGWQNRREEILKTAGQVNQALKHIRIPQSEDEIKLEALENGYTALESIFDSTYGGFGQAPKFPQPSYLLFLLSYHHRTENPKALEMVKKTLDEMSDGGIYDHLGGGFARYSTDKFWLTPHFEKMLYDQALLTMAYIRAYQVTGNKKYANLTKAIFDYVLRDMTDELGGFYSAEDADSEGEEGKFYVWKKSEIEKALGKEDAEIFNSYYNVTEGGNFEHNTNILHVKVPVESIAEQFNKTPEDVENILTDGRQKLFAIRNKRVRPHLDDKVITAWNGLMIASMAYGGAVLGEKKYIKASETAANFVLNNLRKKSRLLRFYRKGKSVGTGFLDDYAFMILGVLELCEATYDARYLSKAKQLASQMIELFSDKNEGGFYQTGSDSEKLIIRNIPGYDGAVPSGNSVAAYVLLKLGRLTMDENFNEQGSKALQRFSGQINQSPLASSFMLLAVDFYLGPTKEIVIAGDIKDGNTQRILAELSKRYLPRTLSIFHSSQNSASPLEKLIPFVKEQKPVDGLATAYVCQNYICSKPVTDFNEFVALLDR